MAAVAPPADRYDRAHSFCYRASSGIEWEDYSRYMNFDIVEMNPGGGAIIWRSVKQKCVSDSTMEEYVVASEAAKEELLDGLRGDS